MLIIYIVYIEYSYFETRGYGMKILYLVIYSIQNRVHLKVVANVIVGVLFIHTDTIYERKHVCRPKINHQTCLSAENQSPGSMLQPTSCWVQGDSTAQHRNSLRPANFNLTKRNFSLTACVLLNLCVWLMNEETPDDNFDRLVQLKYANDRRQYLCE